MSYFPGTCVNPTDDDATQCYAMLLAPFAADTDLTTALVSSDSFSFVVPADAITAHAPPHGGPAYGVVFAFMAACAGHIERIGINPAAPGEPPFACFDDQHTKLGADSFVFGFARIYVFDELRNANPVLLGVTLDGAALDETTAVTLARCTRAKLDDCPAHELDSSVDPAEADPVASAPGHPAVEQVWVSYFLTGGKVDNDVSILYDARAGKLTDTKDKLRAPLAAGDYTLWAIVRDSRGGAAWKGFSIQVP